MKRATRSQPVERDTIDRRRYDALAAELQASLAREDVWRREKRDLLRRHVMSAQEYEHRMTNGLQLIAGLLSSQSRAMPTPGEVCLQLRIAARRIVALGTVNHRLHLSDQPANVEFFEFLVGLCDDLSDLLFQNKTDHAIVVQGTKVEIPSSLAHTLGLIANELITNSVKHVNGGITLRLEKGAPETYSLSVLDDGPGLPAGVVTGRGKGLGMKVVLWLVKQIGGDLKIIPRANGSRACVTVIFRSPRFGTNETWRLST
ncbi:MAG TPA: sensor histidine kinase [Lacipirellulaceae bacterium]|nr:sensor histidine kinase [Lacipirellulaceae bacterium]